jgi:hypothetical protein
MNSNHLAWIDALDHDMEFNHLTCASIVLYEEGIAVDKDCIGHIAAFHSILEKWYTFVQGPSYTYMLKLLEWPLDRLFVHPKIFAT